MLFRSREREKIAQGFCGVCPAFQHLAGIHQGQRARIGAVHSVVFGGFSAQSLRDRINDAGAVALITSDGQYRGGGGGFEHEAELHGGFLRRDFFELYGEANKRTGG